ncbi:hypothetical protein D8S78_11345 [Natrialba swarupiae]|nr:hypothetical protein [Natrialba swarupiae]
MLLPKRGLLNEDLEAVPLEALGDALERGSPRNRSGDSSETASSCIQNLGLLLTKIRNSSNRVW